MWIYCIRSKKVSQFMSWWLAVISSWIRQSVSGWYSYITFCKSVTVNNVRGNAWCNWIEVNHDTINNAILNLEEIPCINSNEWFDMLNKLFRHVWAAVFIINWTHASRCNNRQKCWNMFFHCFKYYLLDRNSWNHYK